MIPYSVKFAGGEVDAKAILTRRRKAPTPTDWTRHQFHLDYGANPERVISEWLNENCHGKYTLNSTEVRSGYVVVIGFEQDNDAVMFRLMDGEITVKEKLQSVF